jgi:four helix bundle protein
MGSIKTYKDLEVWRKSMDLCISIYNATSIIPSEEKFGLTSQIRRSAVSIPSNIAEGWGRSSRKEYINFLYIARGSCFELDTQIILADEMHFLEKPTSEKIRENIKSVAMMLNKLISRLKEKT